jgi:hypothetical protein
VAAEARRPCLQDKKPNEKNAKKPKNALLARAIKAGGHTRRFSTVFL